LNPRIWVMRIPKTTESWFNRPTESRMLGGDISERKAGMTQRPSPAPRPIKNLKG
jgi:hypothetical protein